VLLFAAGAPTCLSATDAVFSVSDGIDIRLANWNARRGRDDLSKVRLVVLTSASLVLAGRSACRSERKSRAVAHRRSGGNSHWTPLSGAWPTGLTHDEFFASWPIANIQHRLDRICEEAVRRGPSKPQAICHLTPTGRQRPAVTDLTTIQYPSLVLRE